jgi:carbon monoxide dehydrogenase subunit G
MADKWAGAKHMRAAFPQALSMLTLLATSAWCAGPVLTPPQIQAAIQEGSKYKTVDKFLEKGLKGKRVRLASSMAVDGISKYATFFNDWQAVAAQSAAAHQQMRELKAEDVEANGLLHAFVEVHARGSIPASKMNRRYREQRAHLVLKIGERVIQPVAKSMIKQSDQSVGMILAGMAEGKVTLDFAFDVSPEDLQSPVEVILIDGDGNKHQQMADLNGVLTID